MVISGRVPLLLLLGLVGCIVDALEGATPDELDALFQRTARRVYRIA